MGLSLIHICLSKKRLEAGKAWEEIEAAVESKEVLEGVVTEENKGGLVVNVKGVRVFVPASQSGVPKGGDLGEMVKKPVQLRITEVNRARRRVVGSIRSVAAEQRKAAQEKIWSCLLYTSHGKSHGSRTFQSHAAAVHRASFRPAQA